MNMSTTKLNRRYWLIIFHSLVVFVIAVFILSLQSGIILKQSIDELHYLYLKGVVQHVESMTDADDLRNCIENKTISAKYLALQTVLNSMVDDFETIYIYISLPSHEENRLYNVVASTSSEERARGEHDLPFLYTAYGYDEEGISEFLYAWDHPDQFVLYTSSPEGFEPSYTVSRALVDSKGDVVAIISADISLHSARDRIMRYIRENTVLVTVIVGMIIIGAAVRFGGSLWVVSRWRRINHDGSI